MSNFQIIRTVEELEALDPDTVLAGRERVWTTSEAKRFYENYEGLYIQPEVVIATAAQVRAAREAMEQEHGTD